jgi:hypothetical protein
MCTDCFDKEYFSFPTQKDFENFDLKLTKKLSPAGLKYVGDDGQYNVFGYSIYKCQICQTTWWLSQPDLSWRGYFAHEKNAKHILNDKQIANKKKRQGCFLIVTLTSFVILAFALRACN